MRGLEPFGGVTITRKEARAIGGMLMQGKFLGCASLQLSRLTNGELVARAAGDTVMYRVLAYEPPPRTIERAEVLP